MKERHDKKRLYSSDNASGAGSNVLHLLAGGSDIAVSRDTGLIVAFIGERPGKSSGTRPAFDSGYSAERLMRIMDCEGIEEFRRKYVRLNMFDHNDGTNTWDAEQARENAKAIVSMVGRPSVLILCGRRVFRAFGFDDEIYLECRQRGLITFAFLPHPSGLNHWVELSGERGQGEKLPEGVQSMIISTNVQHPGGTLPYHLRFTKVNHLIASVEICNFLVKEEFFDQFKHHILATMKIEDLRRVLAQMEKS